MNILSIFKIQLAPEFKDKSNFQLIYKVTVKFQLCQKLFLGHFLGPLSPRPLLCFKFFVRFGVKFKVMSKKVALGKRGVNSGERKS
jgi:hypothetical protein